MIHVIATIEVVPGNKEKFLREFQANVPHVLAEEGCIEYSPVVDARSGLERQEPYREDVVKVIEKWASLEALKRHMVAPHMNTYRERVTGLVHHVTLEILEPAPGSAP